MDVRVCNAETMSFWEKAVSAEKFEENGLWGLKSPLGEIVLLPKHDQIEFCTDFIYAHYESRHTFYYKSGSSWDCADDEDDYCFYENGKIGLKTCEGDILLPAMYDDINDWGADCDVIYVRNGKDFHYFNHNLEEILTEVDEIPEDEYPDCPYNLGEDQNRNVLLCVEPIEKKNGSRDCYAYNQWVRLSRIPCNNVREMFDDCKVVKMPSDAIDHFEDKCTYIYSARTCTSGDNFPLTACIRKLQSLGCYDSSWCYLLKISTNKTTKLNPHDLYNVIKHFESDLEGEVIRYIIAIDYDESLDNDEVRLFQLHYFWDDMGAFLYDAFLQETLPEGSVDEVKEVLDRKLYLERKKMLADAYWGIKYSENRSWDDTQNVLEYLKTEGANNYSKLIADHIKINSYWMEEITPEMWQFKKNVITWALDNGGQLNQIHNGKTLYETFVEDLNSAKENPGDKPGYKESVENAEVFAEWLKSKGAITATEQREKIMAKLDGLNPQEVFELVASI